jgi:hypothetical protein
MSIRIPGRADERIAILRLKFGARNRERGGSPTPENVSAGLFSATRVSNEFRAFGMDSLRDELGAMVELVTVMGALGRNMKLVMTVWAVGGRGVNG